MKYSSKQSNLMSKTNYYCPTCGAKIKSDKWLLVCPYCGGVLLKSYVKKAIAPKKRKS